jgi:hypothetical protein
MTFLVRKADKHQILLEYEQQNSAHIVLVNSVRKAAEVNKCSSILRRAQNLKKINLNLLKVKFKE